MSSCAIKIGSNDVRCAHACSNFSILMMCNFGVFRLVRVGFVNLTLLGTYEKILTVQRAN